MRQADIFLSEVSQYLSRGGIEEVGPAFFRFYQIHGKAETYMEFGFLLPKQVQATTPYRSGVVPQGQYVSAKWQGEKNQINEIHDLFIGWINQTGANVDWQMTEDGIEPEAYLHIFPNVHLPETDPRRWHCEVVMRLKDD